MPVWFVGGQESENFIPDYSAPQIVDVSDTVTELVAAGNSGRLMSVSVTSDSSLVYVAFGMDVQTDVFYNFKLPPGYNNNALKIPAQNVTAICKTGETAKISIAVASL